MLAAVWFAARSCVPLLKASRAFRGICNVRTEIVEFSTVVEGGTSREGACALEGSEDSARNTAHDHVTRNQLRRTAPQVGPNFSPELGHCEKRFGWRQEKAEKDGVVRN